jgi:hypothetical protein
VEQRHGKPAGDRRRRGAEPLSQQDFRQELERIFRKTT